MKPWLAVASFAALVVAGMVPVAAGAGEIDSNVALFGKDPGQDKAYACYVRRYDAAHLAAHPKQNVRDMLMFVNSTFDAESGRQYSLEIGVKFRGTDNQFQVSGGCGVSGDGKTALNCGIDCDGGVIDVSVKNADSLLVSIPYGARTWDPETADNELSESARFGEDDKLFRLDRTDLADCLPVVADDEIKAAIAATH